MREYYLVKIASVYPNDPTKLYEAELRDLETNQKIKRLQSPNLLELAARVWFDLEKNDE